jgi:hypothetical protein
MLSRLVRLVAVVICLVAPLGWVSRGDAANTATVEISGNVVDTSLSLTFSITTFSLGTVDATGNSYDPATSIAEPFAIGSNAYQIPEGLAWVTREGFTYTVTSPAFWVLNFCSTAQSNVIDGSTTLLYLTGARPPNSALAPDYIVGSGVRPCSEGPGSGLGSPAGTNLQRVLFPTYIVRSTDAPHTFSATIQFTLSLV